MKINNSNFTNFNGIYRLKNTPENLHELNEHVLPIYKLLRKEDISYFVGTNPFKANLSALIKYITLTNDISVDILKNDAKKHGVDISDLGDDVVHIIAGNKDNAAYNTFLSKRFTEQSKGFLQSSCFIAFAGPKLKLPEYLNQILCNLIPDIQENMEFSNFARKITEVKNPYELLDKSLKERY